MSGTYINDGAVIDYVAGSNIAYGDVVPLINLIGIAAAAIANGATGSVAVRGVFDLPAETDTAFNVGDLLYWDASPGELTKTSGGGNVPAGYCVLAKAQSGAVGRVTLLG